MSREQRYWEKQKELKSCTWNAKQGFSHVVIETLKRTWNANKGLCDLRIPTFFVLLRIPEQKG